MSGPVEGVQTSEAGTGRGKKRRWRRIALGIVVLILAAILLPLINLGRYHRTISESLSRALGHPVSLGSVNLTLLPLPGLVIHNLAVEEDPAFGAEPLLLAPEVTVYPRLSSLWRQRLEIARIDLDSASVNLVRDADGRWNVSSLLLQASRTATAPTGQRRPSATPRFPYIEFSGARINFKEGAEKKALSFLNADASVWLADPNRWRIRFEAQPARTDLDLDLEDMGTVKLDGSVTRASSLEQLPLKLHAEWTGAQLGQVSRLLLGEDSGWRGDLRADADITGDMRDLALRLRLRVENAHRLEFAPLNHFDIDTRCDADYHREERSVDQLTCLWPTGDGHLLLTGSIADLLHPKPKLKLEINHTPVAFVVNVLGLMRRGVPALVDASGTINGEFDWGPLQAGGKGAAASTGPDELTGGAVADMVSLRLANVEHPISFATLRLATPFTIAAVAPEKARRRKKAAVVAAVTPRNAVVLEPAAFEAGAAAPMKVAGEFSRSGFSLHFTGESAMARLIPVAREFSQIGAVGALAAKGTAQADLTLAGPWIPAVDADTGANVDAPVEGWVRVEHGEMKPEWLPEPIEVGSATAQFAGGKITWSDASVSVGAGNEKLAAKGSVSYPAVCADAAGCAAQVNLEFPALNVGALEAFLLGKDRHGKFLQAILSRVESPAPPWPALRGTVHAGALTVGSLKLTNANAAIAVENHELKILALDANGLGGSEHLTGTIASGQDGPQYALEASWSRVRLAQAGALFHENWGAGSVEGETKLTLHGPSAKLAATAAGDFRWLVKGKWGGSWDGPEIAGSSRWAAAGTIIHETLTLTRGPALGTIGFNRKLNVTWNETGLEQPAAVGPGRTAFHIAGTVGRPVVSGRGAVLRERAASR